MNQQTCAPGQVLSICCTALSTELDVKTDKRKKERNTNKRNTRHTAFSFQQRCCDTSGDSESSNFNMTNTKKKNTWSETGILYTLLTATYKMVISNIRCRILRLESMIYFPLYPKMDIEFRYLDERVCSF